MPFDGVMLPAVEIRARLIERLRSPPADRVPWDFRFGSTCALYDIEKLGISTATGGTYWARLGLTEEQAERIFCVNHQSDEVYGCKMAAVTAVMVATKLERVGARPPWWRRLLGRRFW